MRLPYGISNFAALRRGGYDELSSPTVMWLTGAGVLLAAVTLLLIAVNP